MHMRICTINLTSVGMSQAVRYKRAASSRREQQGILDQHDSTKHVAGQDDAKCKPHEETSMFYYTGASRVLGNWILTRSSDCRAAGDAHLSLPQGLLARKRNC